METMTQETQKLALIEASLAQKRPFGDWCYIDEYTWTCYDRCLERLAEHLPVAKILLAALRQASTDSRYRVMGDPVVRSTINTALLGQTELDIANASSEELEAVFSVAARYLIEGRQVSPLEAGAQQAIRIGPKLLSCLGLVRRTRRRSLRAKLPTSFQAGVFQIRPVYTR